MIKKILVPTDGSTAAETAVKYAVTLAKQYGAALRGLYIVDIRLLEGPLLRDLSASLGTAPFVNYQANLTQILEERGKAALAGLRIACEDAGIAVDTGIDTGSVVSSIVKRGELSDLIIMARSGEHADFLEGLLGSTAEGVVRRASCPVLVTNRESADIRGFLVAYDGTSYAKKALQTGVNISETWGMPFHVLTVGEAEAASVLSEARSYIEAHEVEADFVTRQGDPGEEIIACAGELGSDLIVTGAYGHSKVRELVVGSTTSYVTSHAPCPVLLTR